MTVQGLIDYLEKLPKDAQVGVIYRMHSDYEVLEEGDMTFIPAPTKEQLDTETVVPFSSTMRKYVLRNGRLMEYNYRTFPKSETPVFVPLLILPGN